MRSRAELLDHLPDGPARWDDRPDWVQNLSLGGLVIAAICTTLMAVMNHRQGGHPDSVRSTP